MHYSVCQDEYCRCGHYLNQSGVAPVPKVCLPFREIDACRTLSEMRYHYMNCKRAKCYCSYEQNTVVSPQFSNSIYPYVSRYENQSGLANANVSMMAPLCEQVVTTCFENDDAAPVYEIGSATDETADAVSSTVTDIQSFMKRPILCWSAQIPLAGATPYVANINPWTQFFSHPAIKSKLNNYYLLRAKLHVKFSIVGGPFYYGRFLASYCPLHQYVDGLPHSPVNPAEIIPESQRPHLWLDPTTNQGGELILPFWYPKDYVQVPLAQYSDLGAITLREVVTCRSAVSGTLPITITCYVWADEVSVAAPTYTNQSGEYSTTPVADALTTAASVARAASNIMMFKPYAKATEMILTGLGKLSRVLGFSRPAILENHHIVKSANLYYLANSDRHEPVQKLSLSSKQELTIDPRVVGMNGQDEMSFSSIVKRESYWFTMPWESTAAIGTMLGSCCATPSLGELTGGKHYMTPMSWVAQAFNWWRGTINFRFVIVCSAHHKGKLLFTYEPYLTTVAGTNGSSLNTNYSRVIDISTTKDFTIPITWHQDTSYAPILLNAPSYGIGSTAVPYFRTQNGVLYISVVNPLTGPAGATTGIKILVFASGGDDLEFAGPTGDRIDRLSIFSNQSGEIVDAVAPSATTHLGENLPIGMNYLDSIGENTASSRLNDVFFGERITTLRQLLKRYTNYACYVEPKSIRTVTPPSYVKQGFKAPAFPLPYGYDTRGFFTTTGAGAKKYNPVTQTLLSYFSLAYLGHRGSVRWKIVVNNNQQNSSSCVRAVRSSEYESSDNITYKEITTATPWTGFNDGQSNFFSNGAKSDSDGLALGGVYDNAGLEIEVPDYSPYRFSFCRSLNALNSLQTVNTVRVETCSMFTTAANTFNTIDTYVAAGEDLSFFGFLNVPIMHEYIINTGL